MSSLDLVRAYTFKPPTPKQILPGREQDLELPLQYLSLGRIWQYLERYHCRIQHLP